MTDPRNAFLTEASAWSGLASNKGMEPEIRLKAALRAIEIYEKYLEGRTAATELAIKHVLAFTEVDALVTAEHARKLYEEIMGALRSAGAVEEGD